MDQRVYHAHNVVNLYLSPYVTIHVDSSFLELRVENTREVVRLHTKEASSMAEALQLGGTAEEILLCLSQYMESPYQDARATIQLLIQKRIFE